MRDILGKVKRERIKKQEQATSSSTIVPPMHGRDGRAGGDSKDAETNTYSSDGNTLVGDVGPHDKLVGGTAIAIGGGDTPDTSGAALNQMMIKQKKIKHLLQKFVNIYQIYVLILHMELLNVIGKLQVKQRQLLQN